MTALPTSPSLHPQAGSSSEAPEVAPSTSGVSGTAVPAAWLEGDIAMLKSLRARTLALAEEAAHYDIRLQRMFSDVEAEIRKSLAALLLQKEDQSDRGGQP